MFEKIDDTMENFTKAPESTKKNQIEILEQKIIIIILSLPSFDPSNPGERRQITQGSSVPLPS